MRGTSWARRGPIFVQLPFMGFPIGLGLLLLFGLAAPWFFHLLPFLIFFLIPAYGLATARIGQAPIHGTRAAHLPAPRDEDHKEKELLKVLERRGEINVARAAPETSLRGPLRTPCGSRTATEVSAKHYLNPTTRRVGVRQVHRE
jgi:hypothetical protein